MREIKFRAWDKNECAFISSHPTEHKREFALVEFDIGFSGYDLNDLVIQQYTGLKDKNGVEIYEGDLIKVSVLYDEHGEKEIHESVVVFENGAFGDQFDYFINYLSLPYCSIEVVGNIFEIP